MSNDPAPRPTTDRPAQPAPTYRPVSTDRPTATFPTGWQACPSGYLPEGPATAARLAQADATPTGTFPTNRSARPRARYHTPQTDWQSIDPQQPLHEGRQPVQEGGQEPSPAIQDMGRPGPLSKPSMRWHPSLMQLAIGAAIILIALVGLQRYSVAGMADASHRCHGLAAQDWDRAERECRGTGSGTPQPEQPPSSPHTPSESPSQAPSPSTPPALTRVTSPSPSTSTSDWVTRDTHAPYSKDDASASPLDLPRCTTAPDTPLPCLAHASADGSHAVVLEEDGSMTGLVRR